MRKAIRLNLVILVIAMVFTSGTAFAGNTEIGTLSGPHFNINIIGHPKGYRGTGDDSSGHSIMVPLKTVNGQVEPVCGIGSGVVTDYTKSYQYYEPTAGVKIYFERGTSFEITDRDATDGSATIYVPVDSLTGDMYFDAYIRVLGKPNQCMNITAYAYDKADATHVDTWYQTGTVKLSRAKGKSTFVQVNELFTVCVPVITSTGTQCDYRSAFNLAFQDYFWSILNNGTRLVQLRLYPKSSSAPPPADVP